MSSLTLWGFFVQIRALKMEKKLNYKDQLALDRTKLANERTFLAYFRTAVVFISSGFAIIKLDLLNELKDLGIALIILGPLLILFGITRFFVMNKKFKNYTLD